MKWNPDISNSKNLCGSEEILQFIQSRPGFKVVFGAITIRTKVRSYAGDAIFWRRIKERDYLIVVINKNGWQNVFIETDETLFQCLIASLSEGFKGNTMKIYNIQGTTIEYNGPDFDINYDILKLIFDLLQDSDYETPIIDTVFRLFSLIYKYKIPLCEAQEQISELITEINRFKIQSQSATEELRQNIEETTEKNTKRIDELDAILINLNQEIENLNQAINEKQTRISVIESEINHLLLEMREAANQQNLQRIMEINPIIADREKEKDSLDNEIQMQKENLEVLRTQKTVHQVEYKRINRDLAEKGKVLAALRTIDEFVRSDKKPSRPIHTEETTSLDIDPREIEQSVRLFDKLLTFQFFGKENTWLGQRLIKTKGLKPSQILLAVIQGKEELKKLLESVDCLSNYFAVLASLESNAILKDGVFNPEGAQQFLNLCFQSKRWIKANLRESSDSEVK